MQNDSIKRTILNGKNSWYIRIISSQRLKTILRFYIAKLAYEGWTEEDRIVAIELILRNQNSPCKILAFYAKLVENLYIESERYSIFKPLFYLKQFFPSSLMSKFAYFGMKNQIRVEFCEEKFGYQPRNSYRRGVSPSGIRPTPSNSSISWEEICRYTSYENPKPRRVISILGVLGGVIFHGPP